MKTAKFDFGIEAPPGVPLPDSYAFQQGKSPDKTFVVSRKKSGGIASVYSDIEWDFSAYTPDGRSFKIHFARWCSSPMTDSQAIIVAELRWLMFILLWIRQGPTLANTTLRSYFQALREVAEFAGANNLTVNKIISDTEILKSFLIGAMPHNVGMLSSLFRILFEIGEQATGIKLAGSEATNYAKATGKDYKQTLKQHPPLPTRIYSDLIAGLARELDDFELLADQYLRLVRNCYLDPALGRAQRTQRKILTLEGKQYDFHPTMSDVLEAHGLSDYFKSKSLRESIQSVPRGITNIFVTAKLMIHIFSGMRDREVANLTLDCLEESGLGNKLHYKIAGGTTKLNRGNVKRTRWVTSREGARAIKILQRISGAIYDLIGCPAGSRRNASPLFVSLSYLGFAGKVPITHHDNFAASKIDDNYTVELLTRVVPIVDERDLLELEQIDPHRAWRSEGRFVIGKPWPLSTHQLRRSLALYASRSGFVTLPTLRRQLQHVTDEMARYYANGSEYAENIISGYPDHFGKEWQETQPESQALAYIANVLLSGDRLFGAHGTWVENNIKHGNGVITFDDRAKTIRQFKAGQVAYRETNLGGCTEIISCDKKAMRSVIACFDCSKTVIKMPKLDRLIAAQTNLVNQLDQSTIEWRTEQADLDVLKGAKLKFEQQEKRQSL